MNLANFKYLIFFQWQMCYSLNFLFFQQSKSIYKAFVLLFLLIPFSKSYSQKQANIWYINQSNGIDFNSGYPQIKTGFIPAATDRGGQSISDNNGHLLFYTDGYTVYNKNNQPMPNGSGILGRGWQTLVAQMPGSNYIYYIFYIYVNGFGASCQLYYSVIDMSMNNGLGDVASQKNIFILDNLNQKLGTTIHHNGSDLWINAHDKQGNTFYCFLLSGSGFNPVPVINNIGHYYDSGAIVTPGQIRSSPDGSKLVMANPLDTLDQNLLTTSSIEFFSFDNATAQMSNPIFLRGFDYGGGYGLTGLEFSPNGRFVYACNAGQDSISYYQYDVCNYTPQAVINSQIEVASIYCRAQFESYDLQLAPDSKIYSINYPLSALNVIQNPDNPGTACNFLQNGFSTGTFNGFTLPYFSNTIINAISKGRFNATNTCLGQPTIFSLNETADSVKWDFGELVTGVFDTSSSTNPSHTYQANGAYTIKAILYTSCYIDTLSKVINIVSSASNFLGNDTVLCDSQLLTLYANVPGINYTWQDSSNYNSYTVSKAGKYWVRVSQSGCVISDTVNVAYKPLPALSLGNDTTLCIGNSFVLNAANPGASYIWNDNSNAQTKTVNLSGKYWVAVTFNGCSASDTIICNFVVGPAIALGNDTTLCKGQKLLLNAANTISNVTYLWNNNSTADTLVVAQNGKYWVNATANGCTNSDTIQVNYNPIPDISLGNDTTLCNGQTILLLAPESPGYQYLWQDQSIADNYTVSDPGTFSVKVTNQFNCSASDTIKISYKPVPIFSIANDTVLCNGHSFLIQPTVLLQGSYLWSDGSTATTLNVTGPGLYWLKVSDGGCAKSDSITVTYKPMPALSLGNDTTLCIGQVLMLSAVNNNATYLWQDGSTQPTFTVDTIGTYSVKIDKNGCDTTGNIIVDYITKPVVNLGSDTSLCITQQLLLNATYLLSTYLWQDGSVLPQFNVSQAGTYSVYVTNACGDTKDSISVTYENCACKFYVPSAFTPNNDGKNDVFQPKYQCLFSNYELKVFNRWGQLIFVSSNSSLGWDGSFSGQQQPSGAYIWELSYKDILTGKNIRKNGTVVLIR